MTQAPGDSSGPASSPDGGHGPTRQQSYRRPWFALAFAGAAVVMLVLTIALASLHGGLVHWPGWVQRVVDLVILSAPLLIAVVLAGRLAADGVARAVGIRRWTWTDAALGLLVALVARALTELVEPTAGALLGPFDVDVTLAVIAETSVLVAGIVLVTPVIEELFFRGLMLRALDDALSGAGRVIAGTVALVVSTVVFTLLHAVPAGANVSVGLVVATLAVGVGCGILTLLTGRLGGAIVAHVVFNAIGVALLIW